ncbi:MAG: 30S ribosomal protein S27ae [Methanomassiliicoccus sp.]|jgi:small subunit ribosomal protein S27Ae|nr:30S ribosomal protein S27ae [Methanomassiliicoccus sp.]
MAKDAKAAGAAPADKKPESKDKGKAAAGKKAGGEASAKKDHYTVKDGKLERKGRNCPKCGPGVFLAEHKDRNSCGKCGYTEFKNKK